MLSWLPLPKEIVLFVFSFLNKNDHKSLRLTSRETKAAEEIFSKINSTAFDALPLFQVIVNQLFVESPNIVPSSFTIKCAKEKAIQMYCTDFEKEMNSLSKMNSILQYMNVTEDQYKKEKEKFNQIASIQVTKENIIERLKVFETWVLEKFSSIAKDNDSTKAFKTLDLLINNGHYFSFHFILSSDGITTALKGSDAALLITRTNLHHMLKKGPFNIVIRSGMFQEKYPQNPMIPIVLMHYLKDAPLSQIEGKASMEIAVTVGNVPCAKLILAYAMSFETHYNITQIINENDPSFFIEKTKEGLENYNSELNHQPSWLTTAYTTVSQAADFTSNSNPYASEGERYKHLEFAPAYMDGHKEVIAFLEYFSTELSKRTQKKETAQHVEETLSLAVPISVASNNHSSWLMSVVQSASHYLPSAFIPSLGFSSSATGRKRKAQDMTADPTDESNLTTRAEKIQRL